MMKETRPSPSATAAEAAPDALPGGRVYPWVFLISGMFLCIYLSRAVFGPLLPHIERDFDITHAASTRLLLYMSIGYAAGIFISGFTATRLQSRFMVGVSVAGSGAMMVCVAQTGTMGYFAALLIILGLVGGHYLNGGISVMRDIVRPSQWSMAVAVHEMGPNASFLIVPILAEFGASAFGWRFVIGAMGWFCIAAGLIFARIAKGGRTTSPRLSLSRVGGIIKNPMAWLFAWLSGIGVAGEIATYSVLTMYLVEERAVDSETAAYLLSLSRVASPCTVFLGGWLCKRLGSKKSLIICLAGFAVSLLLMAAPRKELFLPGMFLQPAVCAMIFPPIFTFLMEQFAATDHSTVMALSMPAACLLGIGVIPSLLGLCGDTLGFAAGFILLAAVVAATLPLLATVRPPRS